MVEALNAIGLHVVLDVVYNHTPNAGQDPKSILDRIVPGYYHRLDAAGNVEHSTCCANTASEHRMMEKLMLDSLETWVEQYRVDGFRFDLMGHHTKANLLKVRERFPHLQLYGEGWSFGEVAGDALFVAASQRNMAGTGIATFGDRLRDAVRGGGPHDHDPRRHQGFATGLADAPSKALEDAQDEVMRGLASGADQIAYVDAHDNETLFDALALKLPQETTMDDRVRMNTLALATVTLSQSPCFWHAGTDLLRSKSLDRNSYDSGDWFNRVDWTATHSTFGSGLPPRWDNFERWKYLRPLLQDPGLKPQPHHIRDRPRPRPRAAAHPRLDPALRRRRRDLRTRCTRRDRDGPLGRDRRDLQRHPAPHRADRASARNPASPRAGRTRSDLRGRRLHRPGADRRSVPSVSSTPIGSTISKERIPSGS